MIETISGLSAAFGLSGSAGLNAYIPLLLVALAARFPISSPLIKLQPPYDLMGSWWIIGLLVVLLVVEIIADKVPAVDTVNDGIQTFVRPAAGAILFAGSTSAVTEINPLLAIVAGVLVAGSVHATKAAARPVVTVSTMGVGNPVVSTLEDVTAFVVSLLALFLPIIAGLLMVGFLIIAIVMVRRRRQKRTAF